MKREYRRQLIHAFAGSIIILLVILLGRMPTLLLALLAFAIGLCISVLIKRGLEIPFLHLVVESVERPNEMKVPGYGALLFVLGLILVLFFFQDQNIVLGALVVAVYGDAASTIIGKAIGKHSIIKPYTIEGTLGGIGVSFVILLLLFNPIVAFIAALAMLAEVLPINDNLSIPVVSAIVLAALL